MNPHAFHFGSALFLVWSAYGAHAADVPAVLPQQQHDNARPHDVVLELGAGAAMRPAYEGSKDFDFSPTGFVTLHYLWLPGFGEVKSGRRLEGFAFGPAFRYVRKRNSNDYAELRGLDDIDAAFELGGRFSYTFGVFRPWVAVRYGLGGHDGIVGEAGLDVVLRPTEAIEVMFGPRTSFATSEYMQTYFGVTPAEAARSGLPSYAPSGGFKGAGFEVGTRYEFTPQWSVISAVAYERLLGDAGKSPIVSAGTDNQFTARLGLSYRFGMKLFK
jgi:outer membrane protein